jgi:ADP-ribose pyrophosphatase
MHGPDGAPIRRDAIRHPGAVVILPILDVNHVVLLRNYRFVVGNTLWEIPAGTLEPNEPIEDCARRELIEETGYRASKWRAFGYLYASPGVMDEKLHLFIAEDLTPGDAAPEPDEQLEPVIVPLDQAIGMCLDGTIRDAKTITALLLWARLSGR